jgi:DNA primase
MISQETIERVREQADIVQIIGEHVKLRRVGHDYRGPCPFHHGKNPNFAVSPKRNVYHCFKCHESGDVFTFLQKQLGLDWPGAVRLAAEKSGIEIVETDTRREVRDAREPLWEANAAAAEYFQRALWESDAGGPARQYLAGRGITRPVAERFTLGYAPRDPEAMPTRLRALGHDDARMLEAGLLVQRAEGGAPRVRFRDRLTFPIFDTGGRTVGFGGRLLGPGEPKYLNSAESTIFSKGRLLYGLNWAKQHVRREDRVLVVEGYFDVLRLMSAGLECVVAPLGTALTERQAELLTKYTRNVFLLYDSDDAGQKATFRSGLALLQLGASVRVVSLPEGEDPDTFVQKFGRERLEAQLAAAIDLFDRQVQILERRGWFADLHRKRRALDKLLPTLRATADPLTRDIYVSRASEAAGVAREVLLQEVLEPTRPQRAAGHHGDAGPPEGAEPGDDGPPPWHEGPPPESDPPPGWGGRGEFGNRRGAGDRRRGERRAWAANKQPPRPAKDEVGAERDLTALMLASRTHVSVIAERCPPDRFRDPNFREIFQTLVRYGADTSFDELEALLSPSAAEMLAHLTEKGREIIDPDNESVNVQRTLEGAFTQLRVRELDERSSAIEQLLPTVSPEEQDRLLREKADISREKQALGRGRFRTSGYRKGG